MNLKQIKKFLQSNIEEVLKKLEIDYESFGDNIYSTCPVHESSDNPRAFSFSKTKSIWKCWTRECQEEYNNDVFGLIRGALSNKAGSDQTFKTVLEWVKQQFDIDHSGSTTVIEREVDEDKDLDFDSIVDFIRDKNLVPTIKHCDLDIKVQIPSEYFINRGFKASTLEYFQVGDCKDKKSKLYDRAIIPIYSDCGLHIIGYIGRSIKEYKIPKFLIYPSGFNKRFVFYNMDKALPHIKQTHSVVIVEGQGDVWRLYESGIKNVVGMFGRVLSIEQQKKLQQLPITHIIILTDNDQAGRESKIQLQRQLGRFYRLSFPKLSQKDIGDMTTSQVKNTILSQIRG
jgi:5S rRNA maturation endonuclease (ribonuclease M5)